MYAVKSPFSCKQNQVLAAEFPTEQDADAGRVAAELRGGPLPSKRCAQCGIESEV